MEDDVAELQQTIQKQYNISFVNFNDNYMDKEVVSQTMIDGKGALALTPLRRIEFNKGSVFNRNLKMNESIYEEEPQEHHGDFGS